MGGSGHTAFLNLDCMDLNKYLILAGIVLLWCSMAHARHKIYQTTKAIEVSGSRKEFCLVVQLDDLAYVSVANEHVPSNLIVGDSIQIRVKKDNLWIKTDHLSYDDVKTNIVVRKRMTEGTKLPTCSLSVTLH